MRLMAWLASVCLLSNVISSYAESVGICDVPPKLPINTPFSEYSPPICFNYSGLQPGQIYTLKIWLLTPGLWYCASSQWCERTFSIDNTTGTNASGTIEVVNDMDVYAYSQFDWVIRLYDNSGNQVAFTEQYIDGTSNQPPVLKVTGSTNVGVGQQIQIALSATDADGDTLSFGATPLPPGATFDSASGLFSWTPTQLGTNSILFTVTDSGDGPLTSAQLVTISAITGPVITNQPADHAVLSGAKNASFTVAATDPLPLAYQWQFNGMNIRGATNSTLNIHPVSTIKAGEYSVLVEDPNASTVSQTAVLDVYKRSTATASERASLQHLRNQMDLYHNRILVYDDIGSGGNHFFARGKIPDASASVTMNGSWPDNPHSGATATRCTFDAVSNNFGGFYFMNGILVSNAPLPYFGDAFIEGTDIPVTNYTGVDLSGATSLTFWARGEKGGEKIEFFMGGVGWDPTNGIPAAMFPDSCPRNPRQGTIFKLDTNWQEFTISLAGLNLTNIMGGFGWVASATNNPTGAVFYIDDIQYNLNGSALARRLNEPRFLRSYVTRPVQPTVLGVDPGTDFDFVLRNSAFTYDNALAILAFLADGSADSVRRAQLIGDAFVYAANHDRTYTDGRLRTIYASGDIALPPGWFANGKPDTVSIPGFYVESTQTFFELADNADIDTGNNAWAMIALLALYEKTTNASYLDEARSLGNFIQTFRADTGLYRGYTGGITAAETLSATNRAYASVEHNLDIHAAFLQMYRITGDTNWIDGANHALEFIESMWDDQYECYLSGTLDSNDRNENTNQIPLDTQSWNVLSLTNAFALHPQVLSNADARFKCTNGDFEGYDFNGDLDGVWFEGTGQMCVAHAVAGDERMVAALRATLQAAQQMPVPVGNRLGMIAATHDGLTTGFSFMYYRRLHVGATAWNIFAQLGFNPYYQTRF